MRNVLLRDCLHYDDIEIRILFTAQLSASELHNKYEYGPVYTSRWRVFQLRPLLCNNSQQKLSRSFWNDILHNGHFMANDQSTTKQWYTA